MRFFFYETVQQISDLLWDLAKWMTWASEKLHDLSKDILNG